MGGIRGKIGSSSTECTWDGASEDTRVIGPPISRLVPGVDLALEPVKSSNLCLASRFPKFETVNCEKVVCKERKVADAK